MSEQINYYKLPDLYRHHKSWISTMCLIVLLVIPTALSAQRKKEKLPDVGEISQLITQGKQHEAMEKLNYWLTVQPENSVAISLRAELNYNLSQLRGALEDYSRLTILVPHIAENHFFTGQLTVMLADTVGAIPHLRKAVELDPNNISYLEFLGYYLYATDQFNEAIESYSRILRLSPSYPLALYMRAVSLMLTEQYKYALKDLNKLTSHLDEFEDVFFLIARIHYVLDEVEESIEAIQIHLAHNPEDAEAHEFEGTLWMEEFEIENAIMSFESSVFHGGGQSAMIKLLLLYTEEQEFELAEDVLKEFIEKYPENPRIYLYRAIVLAGKGQEKQSKADFNRFVQLSEGIIPEADLILMKIKFYQENGMLDEIQTSLNRLMELEISDDDLLFELAQNFYVMERYTECIALVNRLIEKHPTNIRYIGYRARVNNRRRDYSGAEQDFTLAIELDPENDSFYFSRGLARLRLKKKSEACADFRKSAGMGNEDAKHALRDECR
jgi:tetratricopeptide (TPR) repeat protein